MDSIQWRIPQETAQKEMGGLDARPLHLIPLILVAAADQSSLRERLGVGEKAWNLGGQCWRLVVEEDAGARDIPVKMEKRVGSHGAAAVAGLGARDAVP
jgi:hypothetical protein